MEKIWLKSYPKGVPAEIDIRTYASLRDVFEEAVAKHGPRPAYTCMGKTITFAELGLWRHACRLGEQCMGMAERIGATIGEIRVVSRDIFDTGDPKEDYLLFQWANALHIQTRPDVVRRALLFKSGDPVSVRVIEETERLLRGSDYIYDVEFRRVAFRDGVVDIDVVTRDTWSTTACRMRG